MFCYQCQEAAKNIGCTIKGVCGKTKESTYLQDLSLYICKGLSHTTLKAREEGIDVKEESRHIVKALFMSITNTNFQNYDLAKIAEKVLDYKDDLKKKLNFDFKHDSVTWTTPNVADRYLRSEKVSVLLIDSNEDIRSLKEYITGGLKGMAAYLEHAFNLGYEDDELYKFIEEALVMTTEEQDVNSMLNWVHRTGEYGVKAMALLDKANTSSYGNPEITKVNIGTGKNPGILISGHDLKNLEQLLNQTEGMNIDIYTHSEMLPAHAYPELKKYPHLKGNYGGAWYQQTTDFETFNGPILFTTNCLVPPRKKSTYNDRVFTTGPTGMPEWGFCEEKLENGETDFSEMIELAKKCKAPTEIEKGELTIGFAHNQVLQLADKVLDAVNSGAIKKMIVMAGCDGRHKSRNYYTEFAKKLPSDTVILTSGCAKYRYNKLNLGDIGGIPRVLDAGQCNDSYSWAVVALKLKEVLNLEDINDLPIEFNIAWYEQKAIIVHMALLYLGVKNIHVGPTLPAFLSKNVLKVLEEKFGLKTITTVEKDFDLFKIDYKK